MAYHVVFQSNGTTMYVYIDNVLDGAISSTMLTGNNYIYVANSNQGNKSYDGSINELRIYNRILTPCEIAELHRQMVATIDASNGLPVIANELLINNNVAIPPTVDLGNDTTLCLGQSLALDATSTSANTYLWQDGSTNSTYPVNQSGIYSVTVSNVCGSTSDTINVNILPNITVDLGNDTTLCLGQSLALDATSISANTYLWQDGSTNSTYTANQSGTYSVTVSNVCGNASDTINVNILPDLVLDLGNDTALCVGQTLLLDATNPFPVNYLWQDGSTNSIFDVTTTGLYYVSVENSCLTVSDSINVVVTDDAPVIDLGEDFEICHDESTILDASSLTANTYLWQDGSTNPTFTATSEGQYSVIASNNCGQTTDSIFVSTIDCNCYIGVPNAFSPNGDNLNNTFSPKKGGICDFVNYKLMIFNRWGNLVFETNDFDQAWDGIYNSQEQPQDTYIYVVEYELDSSFREILKGSFLLVR